MNMTLANYPNPGAYVTLWRRVKALPKSDAYMPEADRRGCLDMSGRRWDGDYQTNLFRDQHALHDRLQKRIIVRQFLTDLVRARFSHLLTKPEDK